MRKKVLQDYDFRGSIIIAKTETASIYLLNNGDILKIYNPGIIDNHKKLGIDIESKILSAVPIKQSPEIIVPTTAVYDKHGQFCGYIMPRANGIDFNSYDASLTMEQRRDLNQYAEVHYKLESVLRRNPNIVFPDFCTCDNIFIDSRKNIQFIDYDGLQVGTHRTLSISTSIGEIAAHLNNSKYCKDKWYFTKELDKKSSIILFYLTAFNIDLNKVGMIDPYSGTPITLEDVFSIINLDDPDICHKTYKIFDDSQPNEYLGNDILNLGEKYDVQFMGGNGTAFMKRLIRKK